MVPITPMLVRRIPTRPKRSLPSWLDHRYDELASSWSRRIARLGFVRAYRRVFRVIARGIVARPKSVPGRARGEAEFHGDDRPIRVIDLGVGASDAALALVAGLELVGRRAIVIGVDTSRKMLDETRRRLAEVGVPSALHACDLCALPVADGWCDVAIAAHSIEHLTDPGPALREIDRVLAPGGTAILVMTRCSLPTLTLEAAWPIRCVRSDVLRSELRGRGYDVELLTFPGSIVPNLMSFVCVARKPIASG